MAAVHWILTAAVLAAFVTRGDAISCWNCLTDAGFCGGDFTAEENLLLGVSKSDNCDYCVMHKTTYSTGVNTGIRFCGVFNHQIGVDEYKETDEGMQEICSRCTNPNTCGSYTDTCFCTTDDCNHSSRSLLSLAAAVASMVALLLAKLM